MHYRQLEAFHTVMTAGSTVRAAELMGITQPAVSRAIAELESSIGFALFDRVRGRLIATPEGRLFHREVEASFQGLDRLRAAASSIRDYGSGSIRIASLSALGAELVPRAIQAFLADNPRIRITLQVLSSTNVRNLVLDGSFDLGLAADEVDRSGLDSQLFGNFPVMCALPKGHPLCERTVIRPQDLHGVPMIGLAPEDRARQRIDAAMRAEGVEADYLVETPSATTICALVLAGTAPGFVSPPAVAGFLERGLILRPFEPAIYFRHYLLFRPDAQKARLLRDFIAALFDERNRMRFQ